MTYDDVIDPRELRNALLAGLELARERIRNPRAEGGWSGQAD